jgi:hypothetical protein
MEYKILDGEKAALEQQVNEHLSDGWSLHGNGYFANHVHYQPMSKGASIADAGSTKKTVPAATKKEEKDGK